MCPSTHTGVKCAFNLANPSTVEGWKFPRSIQNADFVFCRYTIAPSEPIESSVVYGNPSEFVTHAQVLRFRAMTTLLELTNFVDDSSSAKRGHESTQDDYNDNMGVHVRKGTKMKRYWKLAAAVEILCRDEEVVALTLGRKNVLRAVSPEKSPEQENSINGLR